MTDREALLAAVRESPDDDTPRLIYADFVEEQGEPDLAEFIRVQIEIARIEAEPNRLGGLCPADPERMKGPCSCTWHRLHRRAEEVQIACGSSMRRPLVEATGEDIVGLLRLDSLVPSNPDVISVRYSRGFIETIITSWKNWLEHATAFLKEPIRRARLTTREPYFFEGGESDIAGRCYRAKCRVCGGRGVMRVQYVPPFNARIPKPNEPILPPPMHEATCTQCPNEWTCEKIPGVVFETPPADDFATVRDEAIRQAAQRHGMPPQVLRRLQILPSGLANPYYKPAGAGCGLLRIATVVNPAPELEDAKPTPEKVEEAFREFPP